MNLLIESCKVGLKAPAGVFVLELQLGTSMPIHEMRSQHRVSSQSRSVPRARKAQSYVLRHGCARRLCETIMLRALPRDALARAGLP